MNTQNQEGISSVSHNSIFVNRLKLSADQGIFADQYKLATLYDNGSNDVPVNKAEAARYYRMAAEQGDMLSQYNLALKHHSGEGVDKNDTQSFYWFLLAADQGLMDAQVQVGLCYDNGSGVSVNKLEAAKYFKMAAEQGNMYGQYLLGRMLKGDGVPKDDRESFKWFKMAADQGIADAQNEIGVSFSTGRGVEVNKVEAVRYHRMAAEQGDMYGQYLLGRLYSDGEGVEKNDREAFKYYKLAADQGHADVQNKVGACYDHGRGVEINKSEAIRYYKMAAEQGNMYGQYNLGLKLRDGDGVTKDERKAVRLFKSAAKQGHFDALNQYNCHKVRRDSNVNSLERVSPLPVASEAPKFGRGSALSVDTSIRKGTADWWKHWLELNIPRIPKDLSDRYASLLNDHDVYDEDILRELLDRPKYLESIGIKHVGYIDTIMKLVLPADSPHLQTTPSLPEISRGRRFTLTGTILTDFGQFEPTVVVAGTEVPIEGLEKMSEMNKLVSGRGLYSGVFDGKKVVIKVSFTSGLEDELDREAKVYKLLNDANSSCCIQLRHHHVGSPSYIVLDMFGSNMCNFLQGGGFVKVPLYEQLLRCVSELHDLGFIHGDLKPSNVLVQIDDKARLNVKLCDFDSAQRVGEFFNHTNGFMKYTNAWVCPEVYFGIPNVTKALPSIDVFGLGLIAGVLFDSEVSENKTILPKDDGTSSHVLEVERILKDQQYLHALLPCQAEDRFKDMVHHMCMIDPTSRATLKDTIATFNKLGATALHQQVKRTEEDLSILKIDIVSKIDSLLETTSSLGKCLQILIKQNQEIQRSLKTIISGVYDCPTLFVILPEMSSKWTNKLNPMHLVQDRYRLFFLCSHTMKHAPCGPEGKGYLVTCPKAWLVRAAPYIKLGLSLLKQVLATYGIPLPVAEIMKIDGDTALGIEYINKAIKITTDCLDLNPVAIRQSIQVNQGSIREAYEQMKPILESGNHWATIQATCGLKQVTHEGNVAWILKDSKVEADYIESLGVADDYKLSTSRSTSVCSSSESSSSPVTPVPIIYAKVVSVTPMVPAPLIIQSQFLPPPQQVQLSAEDLYQRAISFATLTPPNSVEALHFFCLSASMGHMLAQYVAGEYFMSGIGVGVNHAEAARYYKLSSDQGYAAAQFKMGECYENGHGVLKNKSEATKMFKLAASQNHVLAKEKLSIVHRLTNLW